MTFKKLIGAGLAGLTALAVAVLFIDPSLAQTAAPAASPAAPAALVINKGDNAWMMTSTVLVLLMTIPGLALFYAGMVRPKNALSVLTHVFYTVCVVTVIWVVYGYSLAFTGGSSVIGGLDKLFLKGVTADSQAATFSVGVPIGEYVYICFQMTFAAITPALIVGAFAERMKFSAVAIFIPLWVTLVYFPIAHMVWYWAGPDAIDAAAKALAAAGDDAAKKVAQAKLDEVMADGGCVFLKGAIDFAGGTVVHINSGIAGLIGALCVGKRVGFGKELMSPHSLVMTMIGASLLWVGWFGFNAGSNLEAVGGAPLAMINSFVATAAAALSWMFAEWIFKGKPSMLGVVSGCVAGLVAVTPASGFAGPMGAIVLGLVVGVGLPVLRLRGEEHVRLRRRARRVRRALRRRHRRRDRHRHPGGARPRRHRHHGLHHRQDRRLRLHDPDDRPVLGGGHHAGLVRCRLVDHLQVIDFTIGFRPTVEREREGLDLTDHGERAYNM